MKPFAKITKPALVGVFPRRRLLRRLEAAFASHPAVWIGAPAGSGKTMLAASFAEVRRKPCLWYGMDARDADPASFFYYVRAAVAEVAPRKAQNLPLLTPEFALGLEAYTRSFFEQLGACVPANTAIVLDDFQELPEHSPLQKLVPVALASLPENVRVVIASRAAPPAPFARLLAHGRLACIPPEELNLTDAEARELARARKVPTLEAKGAAAVLARTGGWMAGTILLLERGATEVVHPDAVDPSAREVAFQYFDSEIFDRAPPETRRFLLETALLPHVSVEAAVALTGEDRAAEILSRLVRRNDFTSRLSGAKGRYRYHPLFREFLLSRARDVVPKDRWVALIRRAADLLAGEGAFEDAASLMIEACDHERLARLVVEQAPALVAQGRLATVEGWIRALPAEVRDASARLSCLLGECRSPFSPSEARAHFERAYELFKGDADSAGMLVAWSGLAKTFSYVWDRFEPLDRWISELEALLQREPSFPSPEVEGHVTLGMISCLMWRQPGHAEIDRWIERATSLLESSVSTELRMQLGAYLALYRLWWKGDHAAAGRLLDETRPLLAESNVAPQTQLLWWVIEAAYRGRMGDRDACYAAVERGLAKAEASGIGGLSLTLAAEGVYGALASGDLAGAARYLGESTKYLVLEHATNTAHLRQLGAWTALCAGEIDRAREQARAMCEYACASGADLAHPWGWLTVAHLLAEQGRHAEALAPLERSLEWSRRTRNPLVEHSCLLSFAHVLLAAGRESDAIERLREAMALGREREFVTHPWIGWRRDVMSRLAALALEHEIEVEHVRAQILASRLPAPPTAPDRWPFPVRVYTFGEFQLWRGDRRISFQGKAQRKPLELLQLLVALGGDDVREDAITERLWPDADGDAAHHALETTLYRLRKLLGPGAVLQRERRLNLDRQTCWADAVALLHAVDEIPSSLGDLARDWGDDPASRERTERELERSIDRVARLYGGPFLAAEGDDLPWVTGERERLRRVVARVGAAIELHAARAGLSHLAARIRRRLAEVDPGAVAGALLALNPATAEVSTRSRGHG